MNVCVVDLITHRLHVIRLILVELKKDVDLPLGQLVQAIHLQRVLVIGQFEVGEVELEFGLVGIATG